MPIDKKSIAAVNKAIESHHAELTNLSQKIEELEQQRALVKGAAMAELAKAAENLRIPKEAIGHLVAGCW